MRLAYSQQANFLLLKPDWSEHCACNYSCCRAVDMTHSDRLCLYKTHGCKSQAALGDCLVMRISRNA